MNADASRVCLGIGCAVLITLSVDGRWHIDSGGVGGAGATASCSGRVEPAVVTPSRSNTVGITSMVRASLAMYNTFGEIDMLAEGLKRAARMLRS